VKKPLYNPSKGGEINPVRGLAKELGRFGIRVHTMCPDAVLEGSSLWTKGGGYLEGTAMRYGIPIKQIPECYRTRCALNTNTGAEDTANATFFRPSERASTMAGNIRTEDGGVTFPR
jgi:NAD(P)-dependent dehydrogenase (short-subunit alcohol dehydrogenase family)